MVRNFTDISGRIKQLNQQGQAGHFNKEVILPPPTPEQFNIQEKAEHQPNKETADFVKVRPETINLPPDLKKMGLQTAPPISQFSGYQNITLPISDDKVVSGLHQPISSSLRWLATLALYLLQKAHLSLKVVGGKAVRVFKR